MAGNYPKRNNRDYRRFIFRRASYAYACAICLFLRSARCVCCTTAKKICISGGVFARIITYYNTPLASATRMLVTAHAHVQGDFFHHHRPIFIWQSVFENFVLFLTFLKTLYTILRVIILLSFVRLPKKLTKL